MIRMFRNKSTAGAGRVTGAVPTALLTSAVAVILMAAVPGCSKSGGPGGGFSMPPMPAEVAEVSVRTVEEKFQAVGNIEAEEVATVVAEIDGIVTAVPYAEGSLLNKGDLIALLDDSQLSAEVSRTDALLAQSTATYERVKAIVAQGAGSPQDLDDASAAMKVADANLSMAKARFAKTRITAPFSGFAGSRRVSVGSFIRTGQAVTDIANIDRIRVIFSAPERMISSIRKGAAVTVSTTAYPGYSLSGKIIVIEPVVDPVTRSARIVAELPNRERKFRSGMSADVTATISSRPGALTIPNESIFASGDQSFVYAVNADSTVSRTPVSLGTRTADAVEVLDGLKTGMKVVTAGHQKLFEGAKIMPVPAGGAPGQGMPGQGAQK
jgi:membrane fusion protein (multidrug efflux system)